VELDCALIRAQFIIASRRYLRAPRRMMRVMGTNPRVGLHPRAEPAPERHDGSAAPEN
jgi:hypothetical protein